MLSTHLEEKGLCLHSGEESQPQWAIWEMEINLPHPRCLMGDWNWPMYLVHKGLSEILAPLSFLSLCLKQNSSFPYLLLYAVHFVQNGPTIFLFTRNQNLAVFRKLSATPHLLGSSFRPAGPGRWTTEECFRGRPLPWPCYNHLSSSTQSNSALSIPETELRINTEEQRNE